MRWLLIALAACGSQPAAKPVLVAKSAPVVVTPPAPVSCGDVAVILRGHVDDHRVAGPMKEEAIAKACLHDHWSREVLECVGNTTKPKPCLDKLGPIQKGAYRKRLASWNESFPLEPLDDDAPDVDEDHLDYVDCADAVGDVSSYAPVLGLKGTDREIAVTMRRQHVLALCEDWSKEARTCFEQAKAWASGATTAIARCRVVLEPDQEQELADRLADVDALMRKIELLGKKPGAFECKKVVEAHYADARWVGKLGAMKPGDRKKTIAASRAAMTRACNDEKWNASFRGCLVAQGGEACFTASGITPMTWGFPPSVLPIKTGIAECDAYGDALRALINCTAIPRQAAQTMLDGYLQVVPYYLNISAAERGQAAKSCAQADSAIRQSARSLGCTI